MSVDETAAPGSHRGIRLRQVGQHFAGVDSAEPFVALRSVDLDIDDGEFVALVGASGCGKTTILNLIAGLQQPTSGNVLINGRQPVCPNMDLGYMFARDALMPWRTAQGNVESSLEARKGWSRSERRVRAREMLQLVGLEGAEHRYRLQLSQGMRQRVALARTLAPDPPILLMDEPFASVDARTRLQLQTEFLRIWEESISTDGHKKTVIFVTHDLQEATLLADRVIVMLPKPGRIAFEKRVDLPRPRARHLHDVMFAEEFHTIHRNLFDHLEAPDRDGPAGADPAETTA